MLYRREREPQRRVWTWLVPLLVFVLIGGWVGDVYRDQLWAFVLNALRTWSASRKTVFVLLIATAVVVGNSLTNLMTNDGFEGMKAKPVRTATMLVIIFACAVAAIVLGTAG